jgi:MFS family permease
MEQRRSGLLHGRAPAAAKSQSDSSLSDQPAGYRALLRVPGFARLYAGLLLGRIAGTMWLLILVLYVLGRYHSPQLAGVAAFLAILPGLLMAPIAGALLDRHGRARLVVADYLIAAFAAALIAGLSVANVLPPVVLLAIVTIASLTNPLSVAGARSLFPIMVPRNMWERANAFDSSGHVIATLLAAPLAGTLVGLIGGEWAFVVSAALFLSAAIVMVRLPEPAVTTRSDGSVLLNAWRGLQYVVRNPSLRGLALTLTTLNLGSGLLVIALPVLVLDRLHSGPATVGLLWGAMGGGGLIAAVVAGRMSTLGRERQLIVVAILVNCVAIAILPFAGSLAIVAIAVILLGVSTGPLDIALFTLRQRRTDPAWFGRAFAVSMSVNYLGSPIGSAVAGPLVAWSLNAALWAAVAVSLISAVFPLLMIPARDEVGAAVSEPSLRARREG